MTYLLDTHTFVWMVQADPRLSLTTQKLIVRPDNDILLSVASLWEIAIKVSIGKLEIPGGFPKLIDAATQEYVGMIPISTVAVAAIATLPFHHKDPFDRLLAATSLTLGCPLISVDSVFDQYGVNRVW